MSGGSSVKYGKFISAVYIINIITQGLFTLAFPMVLGFAVACGGTKSNDKQSSAEEQKVQTEQTEQAAVDHAAEAKEALLNAKDAMIEGVDHLEDATQHMIQLTVDESKESYKKAKDLTSCIIIYKIASVINQGYYQRPDILSELLNDFIRRITLRAIFIN